jgi:hypothetical protein
VLVAFDFGDEKWGNVSNVRKWNVLKCGPQGVSVGYGKGLGLLLAAIHFLQSDTAQPISEIADNSDNSPSSEEGPVLTYPGVGSFG